MFCHLVRLYRKVKNLVVRAVAVLASRTAPLASRTAQRLRQAWTTHRARVRVDATYAAVVAIVLAGVFGTAAVKDVLAAVLAALLGVHATSRLAQSGPVVRRPLDAA